jgi:hypothetical protein
MSPSMMELSDFLNPENPADNPLANNQTLGPAALSESIRNLDQNIRPAAPTPEVEDPMPMPME